jgi:L-rhamnose mutarotase
MYIFLYVGDWYEAFVVMNLCIFTNINFTFYVFKYHLFQPEDANDELLKRSKKAYWWGEMSSCCPSFSDSPPVAEVQMLAF